VDEERSGVVLQLQEVERVEVEDLEVDLEVESV
jgi:hypothetical protein